MTRRNGTVLANLISILKKVNTFVGSKTDRGKNLTSLSDTKIVSLFLFSDAVAR